MVMTADEQQYMPTHAATAYAREALSRNWVDILRRWQCLRKSAFTLIEESIYTVNGCALMVAAQQPHLCINHNVSLRSW